MWVHDTTPHFLSQCCGCQIDHVRAERDVLAEVHNPYVVKLYYSFQVYHLPPLTYTTALLSVAQYQAVLRCCCLQIQKQTRMQQKLFAQPGQKAMCLSLHPVGAVMLPAHAVVPVQHSSTQVTLSVAAHGQADMLMPRHLLGWLSLQALARH